MSGTPKKYATRSNVPQVPGAPVKNLKRKIVDYEGSYESDGDDANNDMYVTNSDDPDNVRITIRRPIKRQLTDKDWNKREVILLPPSPVKHQIKHAILQIEDGLSVLRELYGNMFESDQEEAEDNISV